MPPTIKRIIGCAFTVANALGPGFVEKVYENALAHEIRKYGVALFNSGALSCFTTMSPLANLLPVYLSKTK
jgi:GxxExxY protein